ncbi:MAG: hypothetical protein IJ366_09760 [Clostridia bacterium]|nr:hypothetical protein [Clostridia bacterium]
MSDKLWKKEAHKLYFEKGLNISKTAEAVGRTRQTVAAYLKSCPEWEADKIKRGAESKKRRKAGQLRWDRSNRTAYEVIKREHAQAVRELSAEKYH